MSRFRFLTGMCGNEFMFDPTDVSYSYAINETQTLLRFKNGKQVIVNSTYNDVKELLLNAEKEEA